jgi:hypothetical protein
MEAQGKEAAVSAPGLGQSPSLPTLLSTTWCEAYMDIPEITSTHLNPSPNNHDR